MLLIRPTAHQIVCFLRVVHPMNREVFDIASQLESVALCFGRCWVPHSKELTLDIATGPGGRGRRQPVRNRAVRPGG